MRKKIILFIFVLNFMFLGLNRVYASDINDFKINVEAETGKVGARLTMKVDGTLEEGYSYYVKFVNQNDAKPNDFSSGNIPINSEDIKKWKNIRDNDNIINIADDWYMLNGYDYAYFLKCDNIYNCEISDDKVKVERPALPELMKRYYFGSTVSNMLSISPLFPKRGKNGSHKQIVRIGLLNDKNILKELRTNKENGLKELINYAKNNGTEFIFSDTSYHDVTEFNKTIIEGAYYFVYITYENSDGLYRNLEDVIVTVGKQGSTSLYLDADDLSKLTFEEDEIANNTTDKVNNETTNPKTSDIKVVYVFVGVLFLAAIVLTGIKRIKKRG